ncbi:hypothetical protein [Tahibacter harae]|uniref:Outer membrane repeat protein n=1 Tax=Tahibacter harae TaxID=2963937 RepID=A0ABT1QTD1_9GAMM|nr:hypothetical protein [Tahibacter harae]MCQ4165522.1 hypothetical protein [Tahibacter harae]
MQASRLNKRPQAIAAAVLAVTTAGTAQALVLTVGTPIGACTHGTIQAAINAAETSAGADTIRLTRSLTYGPEANSVTTGQELTIEGGYLDCTAAADATNTVVSGTGGVTDPVFRITANTGAIVRLRRLTVSGGDEDGAGRGGGIYFRGGGILEISDSLITQNSAGYGGGIYAEGTDSTTELVIGANVAISNNTARYSGGGVVADGIEMSMLEANSILTGNHALGNGGTGGYGGGLHIYSGNRASYAYIGSGVPAFGALYDNDAIYGGGVAIDGANTARLQFYTTDPSRQAGIRYNTASLRGGAIHVKSANSAAELWNVTLDNNSAPDGGAVYVGANAGFFFNFGSKPAAAADCPIGKHCGRIVQNTATTGAIIYGEDGATLQLGYLPSSAPPDPRGGVLIQDNSAASVIGGAADTQLHRAVFSGNQTASDLIQQTDGPLLLSDSTIAGNSIGGGSAVLRGVNSALSLQRSILWQPGTAILSRAGGSVTAEYLDASENGSIGDPFTALSFNPRFIDPAHDDFRLRAGSGAVDHAPSLPGDDRDAYAQPRDVDLPAKFNLVGARDIGAFERGSVQPLVLSGDFDFADLRLWTKLAGEWDGTQNVTLNAGSGSWMYSSNSAPSDRVVLGQQCIHLPGPGRYLLNGRGHAGGNTFASRDYAVLGWEFRSAGTENCTSGVVSAAGELRIGSGTSWGTAAAAAVIEVPAAQFDFASASSITITLIAEDGGVTTAHAISAWFDDITLEYQGDLIFANGFQ